VLEENPFVPKENPLGPKENPFGPKENPFGLSLSKPRTGASTRLP
jgi:hypothetical protein